VGVALGGSGIGILIHVNETKYFSGCKWFNFFYTKEEFYNFCTIELLRFSVLRSFTKFIRQAVLKIFEVKSLSTNNKLDQSALILIGVKKAQTMHVDTSFVICFSPEIAMCLFPPKVARVWPRAISLSL